MMNFILLVSLVYNTLECKNIIRILNFDIAWKLLFPNPRGVEGEL